MSGSGNTYDERNSSPPGAASTPHPAGEEPSGYKGDNPSTAGSGTTAVNTNTPENSTGHLNPSAPEGSNITPGSAPEGDATGEQTTIE